MFSNDSFLIAFQLVVSPPPPPPAPPPPLTDATRRQVTEAHPLEVVDYLQILWDLGLSKVPAASGLTGPVPFPQTALAGPTNFSRALFSATPSTWFHLIYAYFIENTRIYELFGKVLEKYRSGEELSVAPPSAAQWLRTTESLFYRQQAAHDHHSPFVLTSDARTDGRAIRRNAYFRMFGMDLNHGASDNKPYPYTKPQRANREFVEVLELLLREVWILFVNVGTTTGDPTDRDAIAQLTRRVQEMLLDRRRQGTLNEEEFSAVATLDWLRLAVSFDSPIVVELKAESTTEAGRLLKIAERVGMAAHGMSDDYFELSWRMSFLLRSIESGAIQNAADYSAAAIRPILETIITRWSRATGRSLKARPVQPQPMAAAS